MADLLLFGQRLKQLRQELGLSQRDFAGKIGVTASALSSYEKGQKNPSVNVVIEIALNFNVSLDWLCGLKKDANRFKPDDVIRYDLPGALSALLDLIGSCILSIPKTEEFEEYGYIDFDSLDITNGCLGDFLRDATSLSDLYSNGSISYENFRVCMDEMTLNSAEAIRESRRREIKNKELEREKLREDGLPF